MTEQERFIQEMKNKFGDLVDLRICQNGDGGFMAWDAQVAFWAWKAAQQKDGFIAISRLFDNDVVVAVERKVESQLVASGIDADPFRLDGDRIIEVLIAAAQEPT